MKSGGAVKGVNIPRGWIIYLICLLFGLNIKVKQGLYLYDVVVFASVVLALPRITLKKDIAFTVIAGVVISLLTITLNPAFVNIDSFYVPWNLFVFLLYYVFFVRHKGAVVRLNYNLVVLFLMLPIVVSCFMFLSRDVEAFVKNLYGFSGYPAFGRFGGVFGKDVNAFGLSSSILILFALVLYKFGRVSSSVFVLSLFWCLFGVVLSGMRSGLLVIIGILLLFNWKLKLVELKQVVVGSVVVASLFVVTFLYIFDSKLVSFILERFSVYKLIEDFSTGSDGGNFRTAIEYFYRTLGDYEITVYTAIFGVDSSLNYVDSLYVFLFVKHGAIALFVFGLLFIFISLRASLSRDYPLLALIIFSAILSLKGVFVLSNTYMFTMILLYFFWGAQTTKSRRPFHRHGGIGFRQVTPGRA